MKRILTTYANATFELDPVKVENAQEIPKNIENVKAAADIFIKAILSSAKDFPMYVVFQ